MAIWLIFEVLHWAALTVGIAYTVCNPPRGSKVKNSMTELAAELRPFAWICALFVAVKGGPGLIVEDAMGDGMTVIGVFVGMFIFVTWGYFSRVWYLQWKNSDDDRWKKRRKKLAAKVREVGGKLVISPEPELVRVTA